MTLQDSSFYARRYILSECMEWNDCVYIRSDGSKINAWKKALQTKIRINTSLWDMEIQIPKDSKDKECIWCKNQIQTVTIEEIKDGDNKIAYIQLTFIKGNPLAISGSLIFVNQFYSGIMYFLENNEALKTIPYVEEKRKQFNLMILYMEPILAEPTDDNIPPIPPLPPNLDFVDPLPEHPT